MTTNLERIFTEWFEKADDDLAFAVHAYKETEFYSHICLLCQQAAEKYLKGLLVAYNFPFKKIHYTATLAQKCGEYNAVFLKHLKECKFLDKFYIPARYPVGIKMNIKKDDAKRALQVAKEISFLVKEHIPTGK